MKGFTLIELIVVIAVTAVMSIVGIAAFVSYSQTQALTTAAQDVSTMLQVAKSRAQSQVIPENHLCGSNRFAGYQVNITSIEQGTYQLEAVFDTGTGICTKVIDNQKRKLLRDIKFETVSDNSIQFNALTGGVNRAINIKIKNGYGRTKTITVSFSGIIQVTD